MREPAPPILARGTIDLSDEPNQVRITEVMSSPVITFRPHTTIGSARCTLRERGIRGAPVVDAAGTIRGIVSRGDLYRALDDGFGDDAPLVDVMVCFAFSLPVNASLGQAAALMAYEGIHRILVVDSTNRIRGIVSSIDVTRWVGEQSGYMGLRRSA
jgi:CBS domain-containing protein